MAEDADVFNTDRENAKAALQQFFNAELSKKFDSIIDEHGYDTGQLILDDIKDKNDSNILMHLENMVNFKFSETQFKLFYGILTQIFQKHIYNIDATLLVDMLREPHHNHNEMAAHKLYKATQLLFGPMAADNEKISKITIYLLRTATNKTVYCPLVTQKVIAFVTRYKVFAKAPSENVAQIQENGLKCIQIARSFTTPFGEAFDGWGKDKNLIYAYKLNIENGTAGFGLCGPHWDGWNRGINMSSIRRKFKQYQHCETRIGDDPMSTFPVGMKDNVRTQNEFETLELGHLTTFKLWQNKRIKNRKDLASYSCSIENSNIGDGIVCYWRNGWYINSFMNERYHTGSFYSIYRKTEITIIMDFKAYLCRIISANNDKQILFDLSCFCDTVQMVFSFDKGRYDNVHVSLLQQFVQE